MAPKQCQAEIDDMSMLAKRKIRCVRQCTGSA